MKKFAQIFLWIFFLSVRYNDSMFAQTVQTAEVSVRVTKGDTKQVTPVMVCITNVKDSSVHLPPFGNVAGAPTEIGLFFSGVEYNPDKNWVGPVRMTNGKGNNENRSILYELKPSLPYWKEPVMYQTSGDFSIQLPPGKWRISLQHGNEYRPVFEEFIIKPGEKKIRKNYVLQRWINLPSMGWYSGDVHVHHPTNKPAFKEYLLEYAKAEDVHVVNMLEMGHHLGTDFKLEGFGKKFRTCKGNVCLVSGQEDPRSHFGHIIGLNIEEQVRDTSAYDYYDLVFKKLRLQPGALIGFSHFAVWGNGIDKGIPFYITTGEIDFVELMQFLKINTPAYYDYLNLGFRITAAAGSDFPWASTIGDVRTMVYTGKKFSVDAWFAGLKAGHSFVTNGPALFLEADGKLPGSEMNVKPGSSSALKVKAVSDKTIGTIDRVAIYNNDGLVTEKMNTRKADVVEIKLDHLISKSQWLAAVTYCDNGAVAHTTPVYFVVDGKPTYSVEKAPGIIQKQLEELKRIRKERDIQHIMNEGIEERMKKAEAFYNDLLNEVRRGN
ncbi:MAG: CehA/McbA family metallohydrolase [Agriterribacter sp.]